MKIFMLLLAVFMIPGLSPPSEGQTSILHLTSINSGGGNATSTSYKISQSVGQPLTDTKYSTSFSFEQGFWYEHNAIQNIYNIAYVVSGGWNLVSVAKSVVDMHRETIFPTSISSAFAYGGGYQKQDTLTNGVGYWLKFETSQPVLYTGIPTLVDTINVGAKWNLIGVIGYSLSTIEVLQSPPGLVVSPYYGYDGMYFSATTLEPGKAYWVKCQGTGQLILDASGQHVNSLIAPRIDLGEDDSPREK